ncbi:MAG: DUF1622 domain-containing protein [Bacteroidales bacterium]
MLTSLHSFLNFIATVISVLSLSVVVYGTLIGIIGFIRNEAGRLNGTYSTTTVRRIRIDVGSYLLLGLEFLIAADILETVLKPGLDELAVLGGIVLVRIILSYFLNREIKELQE